MSTNDKFSWYHKGNNFLRKALYLRTGEEKKKFYNEDIKFYLTQLNYSLNETGNSPYTQRYNKNINKYLLPMDFILQ